MGPREPGKWKATKGRSVWVQRGRLRCPHRRGQRRGLPGFKGIVSDPYTFLGCGRYMRMYLKGTEEGFTIISFFF